MVCITNEQEKILRNKDVQTDAGAETALQPFAYIFDFDGVLVNSMQLLFECYNSAIAPHGFSMNVTDFFQ